MHGRSKKIFSPLALTLLPGLALLAAGMAAQAQYQVPRLSALFPAGARPGETIEVAVKGGDLAGAKRVVVIGAPGVTGEIVGGNEKPDESAKPLFDGKCTTCHEARNPSNRTLTPEQWAATVDRMIKQRGADIKQEDRDKIVGYLQALARAGQITARFTVAPDAAPGLREVRIVAAAGTSSAFHFEVGSVPTELTVANPNLSLAAPQKITLPVMLNGLLGKPGQRDCFSFSAKKGERLTFNLKGYRLNEPSQSFFNPALYLYDATGKEITRARGGGKFGLDPVLDWTAPADGDYTLMVRDLLYHDSPASVYRLAIGALPYDTVLTPAAGRPGQTLTAKMVAAATSATGDVTVQVPQAPNGVMQVPTPMGDVPLLVHNLPDGGGPAADPAANVVTLPALFRGVISSPGRTDSFKVKAKTGGSALEIYASRLGSPLKPKIVVKNVRGEVVAARQTDFYTQGDFRLDRAFPEPGDYTVEISDTEGRGGPPFTYCWDALDGSPDFAITATPDTVNIAPGGTTTMVVRLTRRENVPGPITLSVQNLPAGITAAPAVIPPDDDKAIIVLSAAADAGGADPAGASRPVVVEGMVTSPDGSSTVRRAARPLEVYRVNGNVRFQPRGSQILSVTAAPPPFTISLAGPDTVALEPNKETPVKVKVTRREDFKGEVILTVQAMPPNVGIKSGYVPIPPDKTEMEFFVYANRNARFYRDPKSPLPPLSFVIVARPGGTDDIYVSSCTLPITLIASPEPEKTASK